MTRFLRSNHPRHWTAAEMAGWTGPRVAGSDFWPLGSPQASGRGEKTPRPHLPGTFSEALRALEFGHGFALAPRQPAWRLAEGHAPAPGGWPGRLVRQAQISQNALDGVEFKDGPDDFHGSTTVAAPLQIKPKYTGQEFCPPLGAPTRGRRIHRLIPGYRWGRRQRRDYLRAYPGVGR